jgi:hypothetical protein
LRNNVSETHQITEWKDNAHFEFLASSVQAALMLLSDDGARLLIQLRQRLQNIKNRLLEIEAQYNALDTAAVANKAMTLREFTEKKLNDKNADNQKAEPSSPRAAT